MENQVLELELFSNRLRLIRTQRGFTQEEMAKELNMSFSSYKGCERGVQKLPFDAIELLATKHEVSLNFLVLGKTADRNQTMQDISQNTRFETKIESGFLVITSRVPLFEYVK